MHARFPIWMAGTAVGLPGDSEEAKAIYREVPRLLSVCGCLLSYPLYLPPFQHVCVEAEIVSQPALPFFLQLRWGEGGKRGCSKHNAFRMCYLVWLLKGGEEPAPPFLCIDPGWGRSSCGTCGDGARGLQGPWLGQGLLHTRSLRPGLAWCSHVTVPQFGAASRYTRGFWRAALQHVWQERTHKTKQKCPTVS